ncbi:MAG: cysE [Blastococcus sp.]|jgi:serine O-acetyltransferase|nr:cysE [Blastococcus sp.]
MNPWRELRPTIAADLAAMARLKGRTDRGLGAMVDVLTIPGTWATLLFRLASACHRGGLRPVSRLLYFLNVVVTGADLAPGASVGPGLAIAHPVGMGWGSGFTCGRDVILTGMARFGTAAAEDGTRAGEPTLGDEVVVLDGGKAMGPITIGDRAVVAANALVLHDVAPEALVVGQPARYVKSRTDRRGETDPLGAATRLLASLAAPDEGGGHVARTTG